MEEEAEALGFADAVARRPEPFWGPLITLAVVFALLGGCVYVLQGGFSRPMTNATYPDAEPIDDYDPDLFGE